MASRKNKNTSGPQPIAVQIATPEAPKRAGVETVKVQVKNTGKGAIFYSGGRTLLPPLATVVLDVDERMLKRLQHQYNKGKIDLVFEDGTRPVRSKLRPSDLNRETRGLSQSLKKIREGSPELDAMFPPTIEPVDDTIEPEDGTETDEDTTGGTAGSGAEFE